MRRKAWLFAKSRPLATATVLGAVLLMLTIALNATVPGAAEAQQVGGLRLESAREEGLEFRVSLDPNMLELETVSVKGVAYVRPRIAGWATSGNPGAPELPYVLSTIGVPHGAQVWLDVEPGTVHTFHLSAQVAPVATITAETDWEALGNGEFALPRPSLELVPDAAVYGLSDSYPGSLAEVVSDSQVRGQRVVGIAAYPVQYEPATGVLTIYEDLEVRVQFDGSDAALRSGAAAAAESPVLESLFDHELLNYEQAREWQTGSLSTGPEAAPWMPPNPGFRVYVEEEGFYKLTHGELQAAGVLDGDPDPDTFQMYNQGQEVAIHVELGGDGDFGTGDYILFYGTQVSSKYTQYNVYWLTHGQGATKTMGDRDGSPAGGTTPTRFDDRLRLEEQVHYVAPLLGDEDLERFIWAYLYPPYIPEWSHSFSLVKPSTEPYSATLSLAMFGNSKSAINPDHHTQLYLNGDCA